MKKVYNRIQDMRGNLISIFAKDVGLGELAQIKKKYGPPCYASVLRFEGEKVLLQVFENTRGLSTGDEVHFLNSPMKVKVGDALLGRCFNGSGEAIDGAPPVHAEEVLINRTSFNPVKRIVPTEIMETQIPMIDVFNCLVKSQKIPIFSVAGEPYNELLMRIANQAVCDVVIIGGMGLRFDDYRSFVDNAEQSGSMEKTLFYIHKATDPAVECLLVPDLALSSAEDFALKGKNVLVLLSDMTAFADALKEIAITMDQIPSNRGYPGSLYSDLASRYEKAVDIEGAGSITLVTVTTMPGNDVTHPIPDNTGYITEGQFYLHRGSIDPFGSLSRLKQLVIGKVTREDHADLANAMIRLYADSKKASERQSMGFKLSQWDQKLIQYSKHFQEKMMSLDIKCPLKEALDMGWNILAASFDAKEVGIKKNLLQRYWPQQ